MDGLDSQDRNEYFVTAFQIFDFCGVKRTGILSVENLMDKFLPSQKSNKSEYKYLKHILDPMESNPQIDVATLADALHKYSETKKDKVDLDDSINLKSGGAPHDSDSGISNDDYQLVEELRSELKDKRQIASQLRQQMLFMEQHNEAELLKLTAECDTLKAQINLLKEDKTKLSVMNSEIEETSSRLLTAEGSLTLARRDLELTNKQVKQLEHEVESLMVEKQTLQDQLVKSKDECHRMNDLYASRQANLLEENETLKTEHADISIKYNDQKIVLEQIVQEKLLLEMELRDVFDKSNQSPRLDHTIDVSYTEDQMLSTLDSLNADSRFGQQLLDEDAFVKELKDCVQGRSTNMSLFDEIRYSFCNSPLDFTDTPNKNCKDYKPEITSIGTQTVENMNEIEANKNQGLECETLNLHKDNSDVYNKNAIKYNNVSTQTLEKANEVSLKPIDVENNCNGCQKLNLIIENLKNNLEKYNKIFELKTVNSISIQTSLNSNSSIKLVNDNKCSECDRLKLQNENLESHLETTNEMVNKFERKMAKNEDRIKMLRQLIGTGKSHNKQLQNVIESFKTKVMAMEEKIKEQNSLMVNTHREAHSTETQTDCVNATVGTQADQPCALCEANDSRSSKPRSLSRFILNATKSLFQIFAVLCFGMALVYLYNVLHLHYTGRCSAPSVPWRWFNIQDLMDFAIKIEYTGEIPM